MYRFLLTITLILSTNIYAELSYPKLFFSRSWLIDNWCQENVPSFKIDPNWISDFNSISPRLIKLWEDDASNLFKVIFDDFQRGFSRKELSATFTLCPMPSFSNPLTLNIKPHLPSYMASFNKKPRPDIAFIDLVFHELLHTWLVENLDPWNTPMLRKYSSEPFGVRSHLHLMALQKHVYLKLERYNFIKWLGIIYPFQGGDYQRAWEIVNSIEGHEVFINEILDITKK